MVSKLLNFVNAGVNTVYNPTVPFWFNGDIWIGARAELLGEELSSKVVFAKKSKDSYVIDDSVASLDLQDPSYVEVGGRKFLLGVRVWEDCGVKWRQDIYEGDSIRDLEYFASGPVGMKDVRLVDLVRLIGMMRGKLFRGCFLMDAGVG
jgi:hypothetical protein